ncbi:MAG: hypothetical protein H6Q21_1902, partial [Bacteroidetes bacterium]|nr:hypothetical protein [Bacteroidota bacterium]
MKIKPFLRLILVVPILVACTSRTAHDGDSKRLYFVSAKPESVGVSSDRLARLDTFIQQAI